MLRRVLTLLLALTFTCAQADAGWWLRVSAGGSPPPSSTTIQPASAWQGTMATCGAPPAEDQTLHGSGWAEKATLHTDLPANSWVTANPRTYNNGTTSAFTITVAAHTNDPQLGGLSSVRAWLCGTTVTLTSYGVNPRTNNPGYLVNITAGNTGFAGDGDLYLYNTPVNGYERRIGPIHVVLNDPAVASNKIVRIIKHVNFSVANPGTDPANCGTTTTDPTTGETLTGPGSASAPFLSIRLAALCSANNGAANNGPAPFGDTNLGGGLVYVDAAGTSYENSIAGLVGNNAIYNQRTVTVMLNPTAGLSLGSATISRTTRTFNTGLWNIPIKKIEFDDMVIDSSSFATFGQSAAGSTMIIDHSIFADSNGVSGPTVTNSLGATQPTGYFGAVGYFSNGLINGTSLAILNSTVSNYVFEGPVLESNINATFSFDFSGINGPSSCSPVGTGNPWQLNQAGTRSCSNEAYNVADRINDIGAGNSGSAVFNVNAREPAHFYQRYNQNTEANGAGLFVISGITSGSTYTFTVALPSYAGGGPVGSANGNGTVNNNGLFMTMTSGACAGQDVAVSGVTTAALQINSIAAPATTSYCNPASIAINDTGFVWIFPHPDCLQITAQQRATTIVVPTFTSGNPPPATQTIAYQDPNVENLLYQQYTCIGQDNQDILFQSGPNNNQYLGPETISVSGTTISSDTLQVASVGSTNVITWAGSPNLNTAIGVVSNYYPRLTIHGGPYDGYTLRVQSQNNTAKTSNMLLDDPLHLSVVDLTNLCGGGSCAGITATSPLELIPGDYVEVISNGANSSIGEWARVVSTPTGSLNDTTATLDHTFSVSSIANAKIALAKSIKDLLVVSSRLSSNQLPAYSQIQNGSTNVKFSQTTMLGIESGGNHYMSVYFRNGAANPAMGLEDFQIADTLIEGMTSDGVLPSASNGAVYSNNGSISTVGVPGFTLLSGFTYNNCSPATLVSTCTLKPTGGTLTQTIGHTPEFPWDAVGIPITSASLIGGIQP